MEDYLHTIAVLHLQALEDHETKYNARMAAVTYDPETTMTALYGPADQRVLKRRRMLQMTSRWELDLIRETQRWSRSRREKALCQLADFRRRLDFYDGRYDFEDDVADLVERMKHGGPILDRILGWPGHRHYAELSDIEFMCLYVAALNHPYKK